MEKVAIDMAAWVKDARARGYEKVILVGWSGGGSLSLFYQAEAEATFSVPKGLGERTFAGTSGNGGSAESGQSIRPPASLKRGFNIPGSGAPGDGANRRLRVYQVQPGQLFLGKYVPCRPKQFGMIERTNMKIRQSGQADRFASQR